jgi:hypothetical protein
MRSFNPYPRNKEEKLISRMINSVFYFLKFVFILKEGDHYRLVVIQDRDKIIDKNYQTLKGAKIACTKMLRNKFKNNEMNPEWSFLYPADEKWLQDKLNRKNSILTTSLPISSRWFTCPTGIV